MARTTLSAKVVAELHVIGRATAATSPFPAPHRVSRVRRILVRRGEDWAASVLGRAFDRRSLIDPGFPWLYDGEMEALIAADEAEAGPAALG